MQKYQALRKQYPKFVYQDFDFQLESEQLKINWHFYLQDDQGKKTEFRPKLTIPLPQTPNLSAKTAQLSADFLLLTLIFNLGLVELFSYWKLTASPEIIIQAGNLTQKQLAFWHKLLIHGMGEYFYLNQIPFWEKDFVKFKTGSSTHFTTFSTSSIRKHNYDYDSNLTSRIEQDQTLTNHESILVPLGGGKDSIVTLELLKEFAQHNQEKNINLTAFAINPTDAVIQTAQIAKVPLIAVKRQLDPRLLKLNQQGFLNGHTPFSALVAFTTQLVAYLYRFDQIALSNESSANEPTLYWQGHPINHQYSKSFQFETDFRAYVRDLTKTWVSSSSKQTLKQARLHQLARSNCGQVQHDSLKLADYFSFLRPLSELAIARLFAQVGKDYFAIFRSCNVGQKEGIWCNHCPKCLFAFSMIFPFVGEKVALSIWGENLFEKKSLFKTAYQLIGAEVNKVKNEKPFECVGTKLESLAAFWLATKWYRRQNKPLPYILKNFQANIFPKYQDLDKKTQEILNSFDKNNYLPKELQEFLNSKPKGKSLAQMRSTNGSVGVAASGKPDREFAKQMSERLTLSNTESNTEILNQVQNDNVVLILGLGREGLSSFNFLIRQGVNPDNIALVDDKPEDQLSLKWQEAIKKHSLKILKPDNHQLLIDNHELIIIIKSPGVPPNHPLIKWARKHNVKVTSNTQLFFEVVRSSSGRHPEPTSPALLTKLKSGSLAQMRSTNGSVGVAASGKPDREFAKQMSERLTLSNTEILNQARLHQLARSNCGQVQNDSASNYPIIIGVTGTKGKSTTSALIHHILKKAGYNMVLGGNVGTPPLDLLNSKLKVQNSKLNPPTGGHSFPQTGLVSLAKPKSKSLAQMRSTNGSVGVAASGKPDREFAKQMSERLTTGQPVYVLELSSHQLADLNQSPDIAVWLNVYPEHLDYYPDFNAYVQAKANIFKHQTPKDHLVYFADDSTINKLVKTAKAKLYPLTKDQADKLDLTQTKLVGRHNKLNLLASIKVAGIFGINQEKALELAKDFKPLPHRLEKVATINRVTYVNDSLATNPQATIAALESFVQPVILITGGYDRGLDYTPLAKTILTQPNIKAVILLPDTGKKIAKLINQLLAKFTTKTSDVQLPTPNSKLPTHSVSDLTEAVTLAKKIAQSNDLVLLSPAAASFNQFKDYRQRGETFKRLVLNN